MGRIPLLSLATTGLLLSLARQSGADKAVLSLPFLPIVCVALLQNRATGAASMAPDAGDDAEEEEEEEVQPTEEERPVARGGQEVCGNLGARRGGASKAQEAPSVAQDALLIPLGPSAANACESPGALLCGCSGLPV